MFFWRKDGKLLKRGKRRARSDRGAVFTEFALLSPILLILISAMFEFAGFWDAKIMANHAAWTVGRIAMVQGSDLTLSSKLQEGVDKIKKKSGADAEIKREKNEKVKRQIQRSFGQMLDNVSVLNDRGVIATMCLMATCQMGYFGGPPGESMNDFLQDGFIKPLRTGLNKVAEDATKKLSKVTSKFIPKITTGKFGKVFGNGGFGFVKGFIDRLSQKLFNEIAGVITKPIDNFLGKTLTRLLNKGTSKFDQFIAPSKGESAGKRRIRLFVGAARRATEPDVVTILDPKSKENYHKYFADVFCLNAADRNALAESRFTHKVNPLSFPEYCNSNVRSEKNFRIKGKTSWPDPATHPHPLYTVKVSWPYSTGWLFPILGSVMNEESGKDKKPAETVRANGFSIAFASPLIENKNLDSDNPEDLPVGDQSDPVGDALRDIAAEFKRFIGMSIYAYEYRLNRENITVVTGDIRTNFKEMSRKQKRKHKNDSKLTAQSNQYSYISPLASYIGYSSINYFRGGYGHAYQTFMGDEFFNQCALDALQNPALAYSAAIQRWDYRDDARVVHAHIYGAVTTYHSTQWINTNSALKWWDFIRNDAEGPYRNSVGQLEKAVADAYKTNPHHVLKDWLCWPDAAAPSPRYWTSTPLTAIKGNGHFKIDYHGHSTYLGFRNLAFGGFTTHNRTKGTFAETSCYYDHSVIPFDWHLYPTNDVEQLLQGFKRYSPPETVQAWKLLDRKRNMATYVGLFDEDNEDSVAEKEAELLKASKEAQQKVLTFLTDQDTYINELRTVLDENADTDNEAFMPRPDEVNLSDSKAVEKWGIKKINDIKSKATEWLRKINANLPELNKAHERLRQETTAVLVDRRKRIDQMDEILTAAYKELVVGGKALSQENLVLTARGIARKRSLDCKLLGQIERMIGLYSDFEKKLQAQAKCEANYADALGSKTAKIRAGLPDDDYFAAVRELQLEAEKERRRPKDPAYGTSTMEAGPDDDLVGDKFRLIDGRWKGVR